MGCVKIKETTSSQKVETLLEYNQKWSNFQSTVSKDYHTNGECEFDSKTISSAPNIFASKNLIAIFMIQNIKQDKL